ncbi:MAG TPA: hypothetical protein VNE16_03210 [Vicinamibacterales bacterium]|nr:hypothetical protein [Vicinamibacterales bacterium]
MARSPSEVTPGERVNRDAGGGSSPAEPRRLAGALGGVIVFVTLAGVLRGTAVCDLVQLVPALAALAAVQRRRPWAFYAAVPIFVFWLVIVTVTWLSWLGAVPVVLGRASAPATGLVTLAGLSALAGLGAGVRSRSAAGVLSRLGAFWAFALLQMAGLWMSLEPLIARR